MTYGAPRCNACGRPIIKARTTNGKFVSLDATPVDPATAAGGQGQYTVDFDAVPMPEAEFIGPWRAAAVRPEISRYTRHLDTCPARQPQENRDD